MSDDDDVERHIRKDLVTLLGGLLFDDYIYDHCNVAGICLSFVGCALYIKSKIITNGAQAPRKEVNGIRTSSDILEKNIKLA